MRALRFFWWDIFPPLSVRVARKMYRHFAGLSLGHALLRSHWASLPDDVVEFLKRDGLSP
jgi:hypothetical protein